MRDFQKSASILADYPRDQEFPERVQLLKISIQQQPTGTILFLEGRLEAPWIPELENAVAEQGLPADGRTITIDLCGLTGMDAVGESTLQTLYSRGATLRCSDLMNEIFVERMTAGAANPSEAISRPCHTSDHERT